MSTNKVMVLGSSGMAGHMITKILKENNLNVVNYARDNIFEDTKYLGIDHIANYIKQEEPDIIINCVGILVKAAHDNIKEACKVNAVFPSVIADNHNKLIHLSTDCVFSGTTDTFYTEDSIPNPVDIYGTTKYLGELAIKDRALVIRASIIGPEINIKRSPSLFEWLMGSSGDVEGWTNAIWSGITTYELAKFILYNIKKNKFSTGIKHICNEKPISKYDLLCLIAKIYNKDINIKKVPGLSINRYVKATNNIWRTPSYEKMIQELHDNYK